MATKTANTTSTSIKPDAVLVSNAHPNQVILQGDHGDTTIQPHVVAKIAGIAVREVPGVHSLVPFGAGQTLARVARQVTGSEYRDLGVNVEVGKVEAAIDLRIVTEYGVSIPAIAAQIRENVARRIMEMTGLRVKETNIEVVDLWFADDEVTPTPSSSRVE